MEKKILLTFLFELAKSFLKFYNNFVILICNSMFFAVDAKFFLLDLQKKSAIFVWLIQTKIPLAHI